ncbi:MAG: ABC transporter substrate-binding protein [Sphingobium sp.]
MQIGLGRFAGGKAMLATMICGAAMLATAASSQTQEYEAPTPLRLSGLIQAVELGPVYVAAEKIYPEKLTVQYGGIPLLFPEHWGGPIKPTDIAGHAETQALRNSLSHPNLRIIFTVAQGHYRIVAKKSSGIRKLSDLKGKKIVTMYPTSAGFYLHNMLALAGLSEKDVTIVSSLRQVGVSDPFIKGDADAFTLWEPEMELATRAIGDDAIVFDQDPGMYENYNLNTTAENLANPAMRKKIVEFIAAMILATEEVRKDPSYAVTRAAEMNGYPRELIAASYGHHTFPGKVADGLLDTLVKEEAWLAPQNGREPRSREELAKLIDTSVVDEARALLASRGGKLVVDKKD